MDQEPNRRAFAKTDRIQQVVAAPWKGLNELRRLILLPVAVAYCRLHGVSPHHTWKLFGLPLIQRYRGSQIVIGEGFDARSFYAANPLGTRRCVLATRSAEARLIIGRNAGITGTVFVAESGITVGDNVKIGNGASIVDTDFHPLNAAHRRLSPNDGAAKPVVIEDDVFIGMNAIILKGTHIGAGAIVGAGSVVRGTVPPYTIVAGNPAVVVRSVRQ